MPGAARPRERRRTTGRRAAGGRARAVRRPSGWGAIAIALLLAALGATQLDVDLGGGWDSTPVAPGAPASEPTGGGASGADSSGEEGAPPDAAGVPRVEAAAEAALMAAVNGARRAHGVSPVRTSALLGRAARGHSLDLRASGDCGHDGADGSSLEDRLARLDAALERFGEVVACGSATADAAVAQWLDSRAHRAIVLGASYRSAGAGVALGATAAASRWTVVFGAP